MLADIHTLLNAVAPIGGDVVLIAGSARGAMLSARSRGGALPPVLASPMVNSTDLLAVATDALAVAIAPEIAIETSKGALIHQEATAPLAIASPGSPPTIAAPVRSLFQTDSVGLKLRLPVTWTKRHAAAVAWLTTSW